MNIARAATAALAAAGLFVACGESGPTRTESRTVAADGAARAEIEIRMGAGELNLSGAEQAALMEAAFRYNRERLKPVVGYRVAGTTGVLEVGRRHHSGFSIGRVVNEWDLRFSDSIPLDLRVNLGAGESRLDLRGLELESLDVDMGVGRMTLDLRGSRAKGFNVNINGGIGSGTIYLPAEIGVRVEVDGGIGSVNASGLSKSGGVYTNDAYGHSEVTIDVSIDAGIGSLDLRVEAGNRVRL
jgi:hypothetical protein